MGAKEVIKNLLKILKIPEIILLIPKKIGLKNIILVNKTVNSFFSTENPGAIQETRLGAKINKIPQIK